MINTPFPRTTTIDIQFTMFNNVQGAAISGDAVNIVHRDQYIGATTIINRIFRREGPGRTIVKKERKRHDTDSGYNQYREIIRGDINKFEQLFSRDGWDWEWKDGRFVIHRYRRTIHKAHVYGDDKVFTAISYHGRDAKKIWKEEFMKYSQADDPAVLLQLFAVNRSNVPILLFHDEWLPMGHLQSQAKGTSFWEDYYLRVYIGAWEGTVGLCSTINLRNQLSCPQIRLFIREKKLWLNSRTGRVSLGPNGPSADGLFTYILYNLYNCKDMPSAMEMATADTCVRFFIQTGAGKLDFNVLEYAQGKYSCMCIESLLGIDSPDCQTHELWYRNSGRNFWYCFCRRIACDETRDLIGKLRLDTVYSGAQLDKIAILTEGPTYTWHCSSDALSDQTLIDSGLTRLRFNGVSQEPSYICCHMLVFAMAWLWQAYRLILSTSGSETCFIPSLQLNLWLETRPNRFGVLGLETLPIVYLFLQHPPSYLTDIDSWLSRVSFWSFDENGTSEIPEEECKRLGLPNITLNRHDFRLLSWPKYVYDGLHTWQVARGFDPSTADWTRSLGLPILEPATTRFKQVVEEEPLTCNSPPETNVDSIPGDPSASNQLSPPPTPPAARIPKLQAPKKQKRVPVVIIHDTDSESEPESR